MVAICVPKYNNVEQFVFRLRRAPILAGAVLNCFHRGTFSQTILLTVRRLLNICSGQTSNFCII